MEGIILKGRVFRNKRIVLLVIAACVLEIVLSGRSINRTVSSTRNWTYIGGLLFSIWIVTAIAIKTKLTQERLLFASISAAFSLWTALAIVLPSQSVVYSFRWIILLMWVSATVSGVVILFELKRSR